MSYAAASQQGASLCRWAWGCNVWCLQAVNMERTFVAVKPDGVQRGLCGEIIKRLEQRGFRLVAAKFTQVTDAQIS